MFRENSTLIGGLIISLDQLIIDIEQTQRSAPTIEQNNITLPIHHEKFSFLILDLCIFHT